MRFAVALLALPFLPVLEAQTVQAFEGFADETVLANQASGLTFVNATVVKRGISLNDAQYPPRSGAKVATNAATNSITVYFATPAPTVSGYYTYSGTLTVQAYNSSHVLVATSNSAFGNNTLLGGAAGSSPNERITVSSAGGIAQIVITSAAGNASFTLDDLTYGDAAVTTSALPALSFPASSFRAMLGPALLLLALAGCLTAGRQGRAGGMAAILFLTFASAPSPASTPNNAAITFADDPFPDVAPPNTNTSVNFTCAVSGNAIANSVTLVRVDTTPPILLGHMNFVSPNYTLTVVLNPPNDDTLIFQCTVGNGTSTLRSKSLFAFVNNTP